MNVTARSKPNPKPECGTEPYLLWAEVLDADAFQAFKSSGDIYNKELAAKFRKYVLSEGGYADPMQQYIKFRGQEPSEDPLLHKRGLK